MGTGRSTERNADGAPRAANVAFAALGSRGQTRRLRHLAWRALQAYDVQPTDLDLLGHVGTTTFRVVAGEGRYVLRMHPESDAGEQARDVAAVNSEMEWLAALRQETDLVVPAPVPSRDGVLVTLATAAGVPGPRPCVLLRWVEGRFVDAGLTPHHLERVGRFTARLHHHARSFRPAAGFTRGRIAEVTSDYLPHAVRAISAALGSEYDGAVRSAIEDVQQTQQALGDGPAVVGLIHADLHQANYLFNRGEARAIDFADCGWGHFAYDLAVTLSRLQPKPHYGALRAALLRGYRSERAVPADHEAHVEAYLRFRLVQIALWRVESRHHPGFAQWEREARAFLQGLARR
jgi:Ser/Thr protein kinase RdoA (MazF antagonist)